MKAIVELQNKVCFKGTAGSGNSVLMDGPPDHGGENNGPRPMEMLLLAQNKQQQICTFKVQSL